MLTAEQRYWWLTALELELRRKSGDAFQDFFSRVMARVYGDNFVRVRAFGQKGDKGCDGYLISSGKVFQCYGALNSDKGKVDYLISKMEDDFNKAKRNLSGIMKEWHMVHNLVDGLPVEAVLKLAELKKANPTIEFGFFSMDGFREAIFCLDHDVIEDLLGPAATSCDIQNLSAAELQTLISAVAAAADEVAFDVTTIKPVPADKLDANLLPNHWRTLLSSGWQNAHLVSSYLERHIDPLLGERVAQAFRTEYQYLKTQSLSISAIMCSLYEKVAGRGSPSPDRQVASQAILAYLFESCDIGDPVPKETVI